VNSEVSLRRQLARLQMQMSEAQRALSEKDDELAAVIEKQLVLITQHDALTVEHREQADRMDHMAAHQSRLIGVEQRLLEAVDSAEAIARERDKERDQRAALQTRLEVLLSGANDAAARWKTERSTLEAQAATNIAEVEKLKRAAVEAAEAAAAAEGTRLRESHAAELAMIREAHERALATLRGELEPKALAAMSLVEQRDLLADELAALRSETERAQADRDEAHARELARARDQHLEAQAALVRLHSTEVGRVATERDELSIAVAEAKRSAAAREQQWASIESALRDTQMQLQRELAENRGIRDRIEADIALSQGRIETLERTCESLTAEKRDLANQLEASHTEAKRHALDRRRFVAYLEEGLALVGARDPVVELEPDDPDVEIGDSNSAKSE
jgi:ParB family chromosome partitioning protein